MWCLAFWSCVSFLRIMVSNFIHVPAKDMNSSIFTVAQYSMVYMCHIFFILSITDGHLGWFEVFAIVNSAAINIYVHVFFNSWMIYNSLGIYPVIGLLGQMVCLVLDPWGITTLSSKMVELIYIPTTSVKVFLFLHILSSIFCLLIAILTGVRWYLNVILTCISLIMSIFSCLLASYMSSFEKCPFISFTHFVMGLFVFFLDICFSYL